jgi:cob(I)alamin adenosyltransferase
MSDEQKRPRSLVMVHTGNGKGKTTAALGVALRAVGHGFRVLIIQFIKGSWHYGELDALKRLEPEVEVVRVGRGFVGILDDKLPWEEHVRAAREGLEEARRRIASGVYDLVILDEINNAVAMGLIPLDDVLGMIRARPDRTHLILTGRSAHPRLIDLADQVTDMRDVKHVDTAGRKGLWF